MKFVAALLEYASLHKSFHHRDTETQRGTEDLF